MGCLVSGYMVFGYTIYSPVATYDGINDKTSASTVSVDSKILIIQMYYMKL